MTYTVFQYVVKVSLVLLHRKSSVFLEIDQLCNYFFRVGFLIFFPVVFLKLCAIEKGADLLGNAVFWSGCKSKPVKSLKDL